MLIPNYHFRHTSVLSIPRSLIHYANNALFVGKRDCRDIIDNLKFVFLLLSSNETRCW